MALLVTTSTPRKLLQLFKEAIDDGDIKLWRYDDDGDFHYKAEQWKREAYFVPRVMDSQLRFVIEPKRNRVKLWKYTYAIYHGRLMQEFLTHFPDRASKVAAMARVL